MQRIISILLATAAIISMTACSSEETLPEGSLTIEGVYYNQITLGPIEGDWRKFSITSQYDWEIPAGDGFYCTPDHGTAGQYDIVMSASGRSSSISTTELGGLVIKLRNTKFVGITVYQSPIVEIYEGATLEMEASSGSTALLQYSSRATEVDVTAKGDITCAVAGNTTYKITSKTDNYSLDEKEIGAIRFTADGVDLDGEITVVQEKAIVCSKETVLVAGYKGAETSFHLSSPFGLSVTSSGSGYTATYDGEESVTIHATADNDTDKEKTLGSVRIAVASHTDCHTDVEIVQRAHYAGQTLIFYYNGTALGGYFAINRADIMSGTTKQMLEHNRIFMFCQDTPTYGSAYELSYNASTDAVQMDHMKDFTLTPIYSSENLKQVLQYLTESAPADRYGLTFSSHGLGWIPTDKESVKSMALSRETPWKKVPGALDTRYVGDSELYGYDITELAEAMESTSVKFDYIIFDACFMGNVESIYDLRNVTSYVLASPCELMGKGLPYNLVMQYLLKDDGSFDLDSVARTSVDYYNEQATKSCCLSVTDCSRMNALAKAVKDINAAAKKSYDLDNIQYYEGITAYSTYPSHVFYDMEDVYINVCDDSGVLEAFTAELDKAVKSRYHTDAFYSAYNGRMNAITHYSGISTSDLSLVYPEDWAETAWYKATH